MDIDNNMVKAMEGGWLDMANEEEVEDICNSANNKKKKT